MRSHLHAKTSKYLQVFSPFNSFAVGPERKQPSL